MAAPRETDGRDMKSESPCAVLGGEQGVGSSPCGERAMTSSRGSRCARGANVSVQHADVARRPQGISVAKAPGSASWSRNLHAGVTSMDVPPTAIVSCSSLVTMTSRRMSPGTPQPGDDVVGLGVKRVASRHDASGAYDFMLIKDHVFQGVVVHHRPALA